jgi:hypothetical protein
MLDIWDIVLPPIYLLVIFLLAGINKKRKIAAHPEYKFFIPGLIAKIVGGVSLCLIYVFYYGGGDTINYHQSASVLINLLGKDPFDFFEIMFREPNFDRYTYFDNATGWPVYWTRDKYAFFVVKLIIPVVLIACKSFIASTILLAWIAYFGMWKLFRIFYNEFPKIGKELAIAILFIPSVIFWGSGLLKDTITLSLVGWFTFSLYSLMTRKPHFITLLLILVVSSTIILLIKPYIFFALMPGTLIWWLKNRLKSIRNGFLRWMATPVLITITAAIGYFILNEMSGRLGVYSLDNVMERAVVVQQDLKKDYYGGNTFDIGDYNPTFSSMLLKAPAAINAALFRPYIWESKNPVMLISGMENLLILLFSIYLVIKLRFFGIFFFIRENSLLFFSVLFSLFFAFSVGISVSNFGTLVRLKIPCIPFYVASLAVLKYYYDERRSMNSVKDDVPLAIDAT